jgi:hypothetical protein
VELMNSTPLWQPGKDLFFLVGILICVGQLQIKIMVGSIKNLQIALMIESISGD